MDKSINIAAKWWLIGFGIGVAGSVASYLYFNYMYGSPAWGVGGGAALSLGLTVALFRAVPEAYRAGRAEAAKGAGSGPAQS